MSDNQPLNDDTRLADLTVGEFKQLMGQILQDITRQPKDLPIEKQVQVRRKSLDEFMQDLQGGN